TLALATLATVLAPSAAHAATATLSCPGIVQSGTQFTTELTIDVGTTPLGAYGVTVTYDPAVVTIASVSGGNTQQFATAPTTDSSTFASGSTPISSFQAMTVNGPTGVVSVAKVTFNVVATTNTSTSIGLAFRNLFDTSSSPIPTTGT